MLSRFRISSTLARKLEELGVSPAEVLRQAGLPPDFRYLLAEETEPPLLVDLAFAWVVGIARRGTGGTINPKRLELRGPAGNRAMYQAHFGCPATFEARHNTLVFNKADLDRPFLTHNPDLWATVAPQLDAELLEALASPAIGEQVKGILKQFGARAQRNRLARWQQHRKGVATGQPF